MNSPPSSRLHHFDPAPTDLASALLANSPAPQDQSLIDAYGASANPPAMKANFQQIYDGPNPPRSQDVSDAIVRLIQQTEPPPPAERRSGRGIDFGSARLNHERRDPERRSLNGHQSAT